MSVEMHGYIDLQIWDLSTLHTTEENKKDFIIS